MVENSL